jgi:uncharacterized protein
MPFEKHLIVDGSNLLHAWSELRGLEKKDRDAARSRLIETVRILHDLDSFELTIVFDGKGQDLVLEHPSGHATLTVVFTPSQLTADTVIEHLVGKSNPASRCWVATDDRAERHTVDAVGGNSLSAGELAEWVRAAEARQRAQVSGLRRQNQQEWRRK